MTALGVIATAIALCLTILGDWWPLLAALVIVLAALLDGIDGAIAAQTGTASRWGRINDSVADRFSDVMLVGIVVVVGAPPWLGATIAVLTLILEITRATAQAVGMKGPGTVTVWERPSRVILAVVATVSAGSWWCAGLSSAVASGLALFIAAIGAALALIGTVQLGIAVRRQTRRLG
ncbi:CDP-alcohol phosphatidyltransferase family protein [Gordonia sp. (in: high G+C Gram-positive bacteria)]|uniref:CDP-alcohol phosphatidyltransferase family protein n=1 Tax=Gordonia sp. (in: high G+C Gram-positive bacteria) TaxID=84139 RepID=UPI0035AF8D22